MGTIHHLLHKAPGLVLAEWDILTALNNGASLARTIGGGVLGLLGVIAVVVALIQGAVKLFSEQSQTRWSRIVILFIFGGLMLAGGLALFMDIAQGAKTTVDTLGQGVDTLGEGLILPHTWRG